MRYANNTIVLTGVGREGQVGEAIARAFAAEGARLVLIDRDRAQVEARAAALRAEGAQVTAHPCDLTDVAATSTVADAVAREAGAVHALVCLAGGFAPTGPVAESDLAAWQRQLTINLLTAVVTARAFLPLVRAGRGAIVCMASEAALPGGAVAGIAAYAAAKSGVVTLVRAIAEEEREHGVRANALAPGAIRTGDNVQAMGDATPLIAREAVADAILFLCSDAARAVTGQVIRLQA